MLASFETYNSWFTAVYNEAIANIKYQMHDLNFKYVLCNKDKYRFPTFILAICFLCISWFIYFGGERTGNIGCYQIKITGRFLFTSFDHECLLTNMLELFFSPLIYYGISEFITQHSILDFHKYNIGLISKIAIIFTKNMLECLGAHNSSVSAILEEVIANTRCLDPHFTFGGMVYTTSTRKYLWHSCKYDSSYTYVE